MTIFVRSLIAASCFLMFSAFLSAQESSETAPGLNESTLKGLQWRGIGPALMSGRIADIAIDPEEKSTWYVGVGSGGVWKTKNRGTTWESIFDGQGSYSIGCITIDPNNRNTIWVGSGENVGGRHVGYGDGVYRSLDGGQSWEGGFVKCESEAFFDQGGQGRGRQRGLSQET